jgi:STE24 endopeptidase
VSGRQRARAVAPLLVAAAAGEAGRALLTPRGAVRPPAPVDIREHFSEPEIARGRDFARPQRALGLARSVLQTATLVGVARRPPPALRRAVPDPLRGMAAGAAALSLAVSAPGLPLRALARRRAIAAGLDTQSWPGWVADLTKVTVIETGFVAALAGGLGALSDRYRERWWIPAALGTVIIGAAAGALAPVLLDPLFNDFDPLPAGETRSDVLALATEAGVNVGEVYSVDASRRTTAANAYVTGLGPTKRVVLFDTMLDRYSRDEVRLVVAHELGHMRHRDVPRNVVYAALIAGPLAWATQRIAATLAGTDPAQPLTPAALPALALASGLVSAPLSPIAARLSRAMERRADDFSLRTAGAPEAFISFERKAALQNLADLEPRFLSRTLASHPPTAERIGAAVAYAETPDHIEGAASAAPTV